MRELGSAIEMWGKVVEDVSAVKWPLAGFAAGLGYFLPTEAQQSAALGAVYLVLLDTVTGIVAARMSGKAISSAKFGRALVKLLAYSSVLSVFSVCVRHIPGAAVAQGPSVTGILTLIIGTEGISVLENVRAMGVSLPFGLESWLAGRIPVKEESAQ